MTYPQQQAKQEEASSSLQVTVLPFWLGKEEEPHIKHIVHAYEQALHIYSYYNEAESLFPRGETNVPLFIGRIVRTILSIDSSDSNRMETVDEVDVYYRDMFVRRGVSMPLFQRVHVKTIWDIRDGVPIDFMDCSSMEYSYLCKYGAEWYHSAMGQQAQAYSLYSFPQFCHYCENSYRSMVGNDNLCVSYGSLLDGCLQKVSSSSSSHPNNKNVSRSNHNRSRSSKLSKKDRHHRHHKRQSCFMQELSDKEQESLLKSLYEDNKEDCHKEEAGAQPSTSVSPTPSSPTSPASSASNLQTFKNSDGLNLNPFDEDVSLYNLKQEIAQFVSSEVSPFDFLDMEEVSLHDNCGDKSWFDEQAVEWEDEDMNGFSEFEVSD